MILFCLYCLHLCALQLNAWLFYMTTWNWELNIMQYAQRHTLVVCIYTSVYSIPLAQQMQLTGTQFLARACLHTTKYNPETWLLTEQTLQKQASDDRSICVSREIATFIYSPCCESGCCRGRAWNVLSLQGETRGAAHVCLYLGEKVV